MRRKQIHKLSAVTVFLMLTFMVSTAAFSQYNWFYGKNKVPKETYDWQHIETEHFKIYYYTQNESLVKKVAAAAEAGYKRISDYLNVKVKRKGKVPIIFYSTAIDFELTNIAGYVPPGAVAFAESTTYRVVIQGDAPFDDLTHTITHELGHIFEYTILGNRSRYISPPLWFMEGFSEFITGDWDQFAMLTVRDRVLTDRIPKISKDGRLTTPYYNARIIPYDFGHMMYDFLDEKHGKRGIKKLLYSARGGSMFRGRRNLLKVFDYSPKLFNFEFGKWLRKKFETYKYKENPEDYSYIIGPDIPYTYSFSHQLSPSGEMLAILTVNMKTYQLNIILISMKDGKVIKNLTPGIITDYDIINLNFNPTNGVSFAWHKDSNKIAFFVRKAWDNYMVVVDVLSGKKLKKIKVEGVQQPTAPNFHPKKPGQLYFTGLESTKSFIYSMDINTGKITKHTDGLLFIRAIDIAPDGEQVVFSAKHEGHHKLYLGMLDKPEMAKQITFGKYNDITPTFTADGKHIYYTSDERGSYNVYSIDLEEKKLSRYTDVMTGNFYPIEIPGDKKEVVMSSYFKGTFSLFRKDVSKPQEVRDIQFESVDTEALAKKAAEVPDVDVTFKGDYQPFKKLFVRSLPPLSVSIGTDGGFFGYSYVSLTDLMGDHNFTLLISSFYGFRSYHLYYLKQNTRLQLFAHLFAYQQAYYYYAPDYSSINSLTVRSQYGGELGFYYPFSRAYRAEATVGFYKQNENSDNLAFGADLPYGQYVDGWAIPVRFSLVGETTRFSNFGPTMGHTFKLSFEKYVKLGGGFIDAYTAEADIRKYIRISSDSLLAFRLYGFKAGGKNALLNWTGGNNTFRSEEFYRLIGNNIVLFNAEFRFPLIRAALTPIGIIGPVRGTFFFDVGGVWFNGQQFDIFKKNPDGSTKFQLDDAISSYGFGIEFFLFGYPMHVEWVTRTDWKQKRYRGVNFWIGFDF
jgi:hypothetical protein